MDELHNDFDLNELYFKYEGPTKVINFNEYYVSKAFFNRIKSLNIKFDDAVKKNKQQQQQQQKTTKQNKTKELLNKKNEVKFGRKFLNKNN